MMQNINLHKTIKQLASLGRSLTSYEYLLQNNMKVH